MRKAKPQLALTLSVGVFQLLLFAYPPAHRQAYGGQMRQVFADLCHARWQQTGTAGLLWLWILTLQDFCVTVPTEHWLEWRRVMQAQWSKRLTVESAFLIVPFIFLFAVFLQQVLGVSTLMNALYPASHDSVVTKLMDAIVVLGPVVAGVLGLIATVRIHWQPDGESLLSVSVRRVSTWQYLVLIISLGLIALFGGYIVVENFACFTGQQLSC